MCVAVTEGGRPQPVARAAFPDLPAKCAKRLRQPLSDDHVQYFLYQVHCLRNEASMVIRCSDVAIKLSCTMYDTLKNP